MWCLWSAYSFLKSPYKVLQLGDVAIFTKNVNADNQTLINHKYVCGVLNRQFLKPDVSGSLFYFFSCHLRFLPNFSTLFNHLFLKENSAFFIGPMYVTLTGFTPQNSKVDFFNWLTLGRPNTNQ